MFDNANLWNDLGFNLCATLSVCYVVAASDEWMKSEMGVSADLVCYYWTPEIKFNNNFYWLSD